MVWGMSLPNSFGEFFPDGDFEYDAKSKESGWGERLRLHYLAQTPEEQIRLFDYRGLDHSGTGVDYGASEYPAFVWGKFTYGIGAKVGSDSLPFNAAEAHEAPLSFDTEKPCGSLGSLIQLSGRTLAVDGTLKETIERREPGVHQFFPIPIKMPKRILFPKGYYLLQVGQCCDSFSPEKSNSESFVTYANHPNFYNLVNSKKGVSGLALSKADFGKAHLWRERMFRETLTCLSDELLDEIQNIGHSIPKHYKMKEV